MQNQEKVLRNEIALLTEKLNGMVSLGKDICTPEILKVSKELDALINKYYMLHNLMENEK